MIEGGGLNRAQNVSVPYLEHAEDISVLYLDHPQNVSVGHHQRPPDEVDDPVPDGDVGPHNPGEHRAGRQVQVALQNGTLRIV